MSRLRAKIDKEIENKDIKKKLRNVQARVHSNLLYNPNQQSGYEKSGSMTAKSSTRSGVNRTNLMHSDRRPSPPSPRNRPQQTLHRQVTYNEASSYARNVNTFSQNKQQQPLTMYMTSSFSQKTRISNRQKKPKSKSSCILPAISDNEPIGDADKSSRSSKSVGGLFTPRNDSLSSCSSSDISHASSSRIPVRSAQQQIKSARNHTDFIAPLQTPAMDMVSLSSGSTTYLNLDLDLCSLSSPKSSDEIFHMAPLIPAPSKTVPSTNSSGCAHLDTSDTLIRKFRHVLAREARSMPDADINVVKNVLKTDERVNLLKAKEPDSNLFKDVLKTQLNEIVKSEKVVKNALRMLGASPIIEMSAPIEVYNVAPGNKQESDKRKAYSPRGGLKSRQQQYSTDSSPRMPSSGEADDYITARGKCRHVATDTVSIKDFTPRKEILNAYDEKRTQTKGKYGKLISTSNAPHNDFETFVKSTLPFKRKSTTPGRQQVVLRQQTVQDDMDMRIVRGVAEEHADLSRLKDTRRPQVDVTFKNVPSVEKEILILKALGKRLEDTLKRSTSEPSLSDNGDKGDRGEVHNCSSTSSLTRELQKIDPSIEVFPGRLCGACTPVKPMRTAMNIEPWMQSSAGFLIFARGVRLELGVVNEFVIISKTVNELLSEKNNDYFIANENAEPGGKLEPIPFQKLAEQPQALMLYLKPKNPSTPFNLLDQDSVFFNSFLLPGLKSKVGERSEKVNDAFNSTSDTPVQEPPKICEGGDSLMVAADGLNAKKIEPTCSKYSVERTADAAATKRKRPKKTQKAKPPVVEMPVSATVSQRTVHRARMRRVVTPMPCDAFDDPKNSLVKTILVGAVQVSIFLVMIMAITYPDIKC